MDERLARWLLGAARAAAWIGAFMVFWSLNVHWGNDPDAGVGPPLQWKRQVTGALLLALIGAGALTVSFLRGRRPGAIGRTVAAAGGVSVMIIAWMLRKDAMVDFPHLIQGPGWRWLLAGGGMVLAAASLSLAVPTVVRKKVRPTKTRRRG